MRPDFVIPPALAARGFALAAETDADRPALRALYIAQRTPEFALLPFDGPARDAFIGSQFDIQQRAYRLSHPDANFLALRLGDAIVGRLYLAADGADIVVLDILLAPAIRGRGVGALLLQGVLAQAGAHGGGVRLHVARNNPAQRLYARLGFVVTGGDPLNLAMEARPAPTPAP